MRKATLRLTFTLATSAALIAGLLVACSGGPPTGSTSEQASASGGSSPCGGAVAKVALSKVGMKACSADNTSNFGTSCAGGKAEYWCADFAKSVWSAQGADVSGLNSSSNSFLTYGNTNGTFSTTPAVGDAVLFSSTAGGTSAAHVGLVTAVNPDGSINTVSGDWGGTSGNFAATASVKQVNGIPSGVGSTSSYTRQYVIGYVAPKGVATSSGGDTPQSITEGDGDGGAAEPCTCADGGTEGGSEAGGGNEGGAGSEGGMGGEGGAYAFVMPRSPGRHHAVVLAQDATTSIPIEWHLAAGVEPSADLFVEAGGRVVLQISSIGDHPFVRAGLEAVPLEEGSPYVLNFARSGGSASVTLARPGGEVVLRAQVAVGEGNSEPPTADVVLPDSFWRRSVVSDEL
jgi:hypothetical protein